MSNEDPFNDIRGSLGSNAGMFGGSDGLSHHDSVRQRPHQHGYVLEFSCDYCGARNQFLILWQPMALIAFGVLPPGYKIHAGHFVPDVQCPSCREDQYPGVTPGECGKLLQDGARQGLCNIQQLQALGQTAAAQQAQMQAQMGHHYRR